MGGSQDEMMRVAAAVAAGANLPADHIRKQCENNIKGGLVIKWMVSDPKGMSLQRALFLCKPMQDFLNIAFKSEGLVGKVHALTRAASTTLRPLPAEKVAFGAAAAKAAETNWWILSGKAGEETVARYSEMAWNFDADAWGPLKGQAAEQAGNVRQILLVIVDAQKRLVDDYALPRFAIMKAGTYAEYEQHRVQEAPAQLLAKHATCPQCVDKAFALPWCHRLLDPSPAISRLAHQAIRDMLIVAPLLSTRTERKHLLGQAIRPVKRGRCVTAQTLSWKTYVAALKESNRSAQLTVERKFFKEPKALRRFHQCIASFRQGRGHRGKDADGQHRRRRVSAWAPNQHSQAKARPRRGADLFYRERFPHVLPGAALGQRRKAAWAEWHALDAAVQAEWNVRAAADHEQCVASTKLLREAWETRRCDKGAALNAKRRAVARVLKDMQEDRVWSAGAQLQRLGAGLPSSQVLLKSDTEIRQLANETFGFHARPLANPRKGMIPFRTCAELYGGLCQRHVIPAVTVLLHNLEAVGHRAGFADKKRLPVLLSLGGSAGVWMETHVLCKFHRAPGVTTPLLVQCEALAGPDGSTRFTLCKSSACGLPGPPRVVVNSFQTVALRLVTKLAKDNHVDPAAVESLHISVSDLAQVPDEKKHACFKHAPDMFNESMSCKKKINVKRKAPEPAPLEEVVSSLFGLKCDAAALDEAPEDDGDDGGFHDSDHGEGHDLKLRMEEDEEWWEDEGPDEEEPAPASPRAVGFKAFSVAKSGRAKCGACGLPVGLGTYQLEFRRKYGSTMSGSYIRLHMGCVDQVADIAGERGAKWLDAEASKLESGDAGQDILTAAAAALREALGAGL